MYIYIGTDMEEKAKISWKLWLNKNKKHKGRFNKTKTSAISVKVNGSQL